MHSNWRDCQAWLDEKLPLSTTSNEAAKLFDASLAQLMHWQDFENMGGLEKTVNGMIEADPSFVLGHVFSNSLNFLSTGASPNKDASFRKSLDFTFKLANSGDRLNDREKLHVEALKQLDMGLMSKACTYWEDILNDYPTDMLALKLAHDAYFFLGNKKELKGSLDRVQNKWSEKVPYWNFLYGMRAFAYCENKDYEESARLAKEGLRCYHGDAWSTHALSHVYEMVGQYNLGSKFLNDTVLDWNPRNMLSCHIHWHNAVFNIEKGNFDEALSIYDNQMAHRPLQSGAMLDLVDVCSLLYRLQLEGLNVKERFEKLFDICLQHSTDHTLTFNDLHFLMTFLGSGHNSEAQIFVQSLDDYLSNQTQSTDYSETTTYVGSLLSRAMLAFHEERYTDTVELMRSVKRDLVTIGGSDAQRDVFSQLLLHACIGSDDDDYQEYAKELLAKRKQMKSNAPLTDRLVDKLFLKRKHVASIKI